MCLKRFLFSAFLLTACMSLNAQQNRIRGAIDNHRLATLQGYVHPHARGENDEGAVAGSFELPSVTLVLKRSATQQADLEQFLAQQRTPGAASFQRWLTPEEYADRFGVSTDD